MAGWRVWWTTAPRWVKVFGIVAAVALLVLAAVAAFGGGPGGHGPGRHVPSTEVAQDDGGAIRPAAVGQSATGASVAPRGAAG